MQYLHSLLAANWKLLQAQSSKPSPVLRVSEKKSKPPASRPILVEDSTPSCASSLGAWFTGTARRLPSSSLASPRRRCRQLHRNAQAPCGSGSERERSVVGFSDALHDCQAETDTCVAGEDAFRAALERFSQRRDQLWCKRLARVFNRKHHAPGPGTSLHPYRAPLNVVDDRVVDQIRGHLQQERVRADGGGHFAGGLDGHSMLFRERQECFAGFFRDEGQVDGYQGERPLVGAAEQEQCFKEVDRSAVYGMEALDQFAAVALRVLAGNVEQCLRDRQGGAQFVGGVGCESLLLGNVLLEPRQHGVKVVGEHGELRVLNPVLPQLFHRLTVRSANGKRVERFPRRASYSYQLDAFADAVFGSEPVKTSPQDTVENMTVIDAVYRAGGLPLRAPA